MNNANEFQPQFDEPDDDRLETTLRSALGEPAQPDFEAWSQRHGESLEYLNPVVTKLHQQRRKWIMRVTSVTVAAAAVVAISALLLSPQKETFAQAIEAINEAETISWVVKQYSRCTSKDKTKTWLEVTNNSFYYRAPNLYRHERRGADGKLRSVTITDTKRDKTLHLNLQTKQAAWLAKSPNQYGEGNPLGWIQTILQKKSVELIGQRDWKGARINVFRYHREKMPDNRSLEIWLDAETKRAVGFNSPGVDVFDPATDADRNKPAAGRPWKVQPVGSVGSEIQIDVPLDPAMFELKAPADFDIQQSRPLEKMSEANLIEWLRVTARFNDDQFVDTVQGIDHAAHTAAAKKPQAERTEREQAFLNLWRQHITQGHSYPIWDFAEAQTKPRSFKYIGRGVKLGDAKRLVCWYKLKSNGQLRAVYGDLSIKNVKEADLPLPIE